MEWAGILQGVITVGSIAVGIFGILGKKKYRKIVEVVIQAIENSGSKDVKGRASTYANHGGVEKSLNCEIERVTGRAVKRERK